MPDPCLLQWVLVPGRVRDGHLHVAVVPGLTILNNGSTPVPLKALVSPDDLDILMRWPAATAALKWALDVPNLPNVPVTVEPSPLADPALLQSMWAELFTPDVRVRPRSEQAPRAATAGAELLAAATPDALGPQVVTARTWALASRIENIFSSHLNTAVSNLLSQSRTPLAAGLSPVLATANGRREYLAPFALEESVYNPDPSTSATGSILLATALEPTDAQLAANYMKALDAESRNRGCEVYFDDRWAGLKSFPTLARAFGLIIDLKIAFAEGESDFSLAATILRVRPEQAFELGVRPVDWPDGRLAGTSRKTACIASSNVVTRVFPRADPGCVDPLRSPKHGILRPCQALGFTFVSTNVDDAVHKLRNAAEAHQNRVDVGDQDNTPRDEILASGATWGLALMYNNQALQLTEQCRRAAAGEPQLVNGKCVPTDRSLYLEDLRVGYRFDVRRKEAAGPSGWASLCDRTVEYSELGRPLALSNEWPVDNEREEGVIRRTARVAKLPKPGQGGAPPAGEEFGLVAKDEWFLWTDWPLSVPEPETPQLACKPRPQAATQKYPFEPPFEQAVDIRSGSQISLRFGHDYEVIAREVYADLGGVTRGEVGTLLGDVPSSADYCGHFEREEPIHPPHVHLARPIEQDWMPGEQIREIVVRSGTSRELRVPRGSRWVTPPSVRPHFAALHDEASVLDDGLPERGALHGVLLTPEGSVPSVNWVGKCASDALPPTRQPRTYTADVNGHDAATILIPNTRRVPSRMYDYYPDPWVQRIHVGLSTDPTNCFGDRTPDFDVYGGGRQWPDGRYFRLQALSVSRVPASGRASWRRRIFGGGPPVLRIAVAPAEQIIVRFWSSRARPSQPSHPSSGHAPTRRLHTELDRAIQRATGTTPAALRDREFLRELRHDCGQTAWPRTNPAIEIRLVHAVEQPCGDPPRFDSREPCQRVAIGESKAVFGGGVFAHRLSTGQIECWAQWADLADIDERPGGPAMVERPKQLAFRLLETDFSRERGRPDHISLRADSTTEPSDLELNTPLEHTLPDFKHRKIKYWLTSRSYFQNYFPEEHRDRCVLDGRAAAVEMSLKASRPPDPPKIHYLVPRFQTEITKGHLRVSAERRARHIRVWIDAPFFSSGPGQELAIVCFPGDLKRGRGRRPSVASIPDPIKKFVSRVADDPVSPGSRTLEMVPAEFFVKPSRVLEDMTFPGVELFGDPDSPKLPSGDSLPKVTLITYRVDFTQYDAERRQYPCDIEINPDILWPEGRYRAAYPYLRLILAAYQHEALEGAQTSKAVVADFHQLHPERTATVTCEPGHRTARCLTLSGYGAAEYQAQQLESHQLQIRARVAVRRGDDAPTVVCEKFLQIEDVAGEYQARLVFERLGGTMEVFVEESYRSPIDRRTETVDQSPANRLDHRPLLLHIPSVP